MSTKIQIDMRKLRVQSNIENIQVEQHSKPNIHSLPLVAQKVGNLVENNNILRPIPKRIQTNILPVSMNSGLGITSAFKKVE